MTMWMHLQISENFSGICRCILLRKISHTMLRKECPMYAKRVGDRYEILGEGK